MTTKPSSIDSLAEEQIVKYFQSKLAEHGPSAQGMDWRDDASRNLRFDVISRYLNQAGPFSLLDVGCGDAGYLDYLKKANCDVNYLGVDVVPEMAEFANQRHGEGTAVHGDVFTLPPESKFDYVIASGTLNAKLGVKSSVWRDHFYNTIAAMYERCNRAAIFNCMSADLDYRYRRLYYPNLSELGKFVTKKLSRNWVFDHSYPLYEMTVCIYKYPTP